MLDFEENVDKPLLQNFEYYYFVSVFIVDNERITRDTIVVEFVLQESRIARQAFHFAIFNSILYKV